MAAILKSLMPAKHTSLVVTVCYSTPTPKYALLRDNDTIGVLVNSDASYRHNRLYAHAMQIVGFIYWVVLRGTYAYCPRRHPF